ncbi:hypothetical protein V8E53_010362 [Lactarius tabidus]
MERYNAIMEAMKDAIDNGPTITSNQDAKDLLESVDAQVQRAQSYKFSTLSPADLENMNITSSTLPLALRPDYMKEIPATIPYGQNEVWSSEILRGHLDMLDGYVGSGNEAGARARIDAFLCHVMAMLPSLPDPWADRRLVLNLEKPIPSILAGASNLSTLSGTLGYAAVVVDKSIVLCFFVVEAKAYGLRPHIPQAVGELYACARHFQKKALRGTLTNGQSWIFLIVRLNEGDGASYIQSTEIKLKDGSLTPPTPDLISAILLSWITKSFSDLEPGEWFQVQQPQSVTACD